MRQRSWMTLIWRNWMTSTAWLVINCLKPRKLSEQKELLLQHEIETSVASFNSDGDGFPEEKEDIV
jgi:hypothetical protein